AKSSNDVSSRPPKNVSGRPPNSVVTTIVRSQSAGQSPARDVTGVLEDQIDPRCRSHPTRPNRRGRAPCPLQNEIVARPRREGRQPLLERPALPIPFESPSATKPARPGAVSTSKRNRRAT